MDSTSTHNFINLRGKVVIVTGASAGLGEAIAIEFARQGSHLSLCGRDETRLQAVADKCLAAGGDQTKIERIIGDVVSQETQKNIVEKTIEAFGKIDVLVNNAGVSHLCNPSNTERSVYDDVMKTNVESVFFLTQLAIPHLINTLGNVVNVSSFVSNIAAPSYAVYAMSKAALDSYTKSLSIFLAPQNVRVNSVQPGSVVSLIYRRGEDSMDDDKYDKFCKTSASMHPLGRRMTQASEVADAVVFLASDRASFTTGQMLYVDGGRHNASATYTN